MLIDWFTVAAQIVNFLILVWLLKRFLYQPILNAIDEREQRIASELASAREKELEAQQTKDLLQKKNDLFDRQRHDLLKKATESANAERQRLLEAARFETNELTRKQQATLQREQQELATEISMQARREVFATIQHALTGLANISLEAGMAQQLTGQLQQPNPDLKRLLDSTTNTEPLTICSTFPLSPQQRNALQEALQQNTGRDIPLSYTTNPALINGIELRAGGYKVGWNIAEYLRNFDERLKRLLAQTFEDDSVRQGCQDEEVC